MPFKSLAEKSNYHDKSIRLCKYCNKQAKRNIRPDGRNKGFYRTCGSKKCLTEQYRDMAVNARKFANIEKVCDYCHETYISKSPRQRWCSKCVCGTNRSLMQRYGLSLTDFNQMLEKQGGKCCLCDKKAIFVDHSHFNGKVRGLLCSKCNLGISYIENDKSWLERAIQYVQI